MTTATQPAVPEIRKGFGYLTCPLCAAEGTIRVDLDDLQSFYCCECDESFAREDVEKIITQWQAVLAFLDTAPVRV